MDTSQQLQRIKGLDSIRFLAAFWVMMYHVGTAPVYNHFERDTLFLKFIGAGMDCLFNGPAAVIVFFVISGFCIHYPQSRGRKIIVMGFLGRRYIRILIPLLICLGGTHMIGLSTDTVGDLVGWSIECELIYYTAYPILKVLSRKIGWLGLFAITMPLSLFYVSQTHPGAMMYPSFGLWGNALLGLPCWLLGCKLAESPVRNYNSKAILFSRVGILVGGIVTFSLMLHARIGFPWTLNLLAIGMYFWLGLEIAHFQQFSPPLTLESAGSWSYSLYLIHGPIAELTQKYQVDSHFPVVFWGVQLCIILLCSYLFYLVVERPSHQLARWVGGKLSKS